MRIIVNEVNYKACNFNKKEALAQVFTCVYCETFKNTFSYRTPLFIACYIVELENCSNFYLLSAGFLEKTVVNRTRLLASPLRSPDASYLPLERKSVQLMNISFLPQLFCFACSNI